MSRLEGALEPFPILLVEDDRADVRLIHEVLKDGRLGNPLYVVEDGPEALEFLQNTGRYKAAARPGLVLLDLNLPQMSGQEVLFWIKEAPALRDIPVIVLTHSEGEIEQVSSHGHPSTRYVIKPMRLWELLTVVLSFEGLALNLVKRPPWRSRDVVSPPYSAR